MNNFCTGIKTMRRATSIRQNAPKNISAFHNTEYFAGDCIYNIRGVEAFKGISLIKNIWFLSFR